MAEERISEELLANMDRAASQAKEEFDSLSDDVKIEFARWMRKWYLKAGYRRLGRIVVAYAKEMERKK
uniref:PFL domain-containing protein n=1 Tax=candidate division WOR-3 bacterium TaxID=2052148 RepID=A0A7C4XEF9_UNCW3